MISTTSRHHGLVIHTTNRADRAAVERIATGALRHGDHVHIVVETRGGREPLCRIWPAPGGGEFLTGPGHAPVSHPNIPAALNAGLTGFDAAFA